jgi:tetratricopeptide (TPR) repeat protein
VLELRAHAEYGNGAFEAAIGSWEALHALHEQAGNREAAAQAAVTAAMMLLIDTGMMAPVRTWVRRADRLLEGITDVPVLALVATVRCYERFMSGDLEGSAAQADLAIELGRRHAVPSAVVIGRTARARLHILRGDVATGLSELEDLAVVLASGEVDPLTTGMMMCELVCAAQGLALHDRAAEWTDLMEHWGHANAVGGIHGRCRVHRAELFRLSGPCSTAEEEALGACDDLRPWMRREFGWPLAELGNIRLRRGDLEGAEEAFLAAHHHAWSPYPGLALLHLAQGRIDAAQMEIADAIEHPIDMPSKERPPMGDLRLAPLLDAQAELAYAAGDMPTVEFAAGALRAIADRFPSRALEAQAALAAARALLLRGDPHSAITHCTTALVIWSDIGAPYECGIARLVLADAYDGAGMGERARLERRAARSGFQVYGADRMAHQVTQLLDDPLASAATPIAIEVGPHSVSAVFRRAGDLRHTSFGTASAVLKDLKGFRYVERLLVEPGREFHVLDLVAVEQGTLPTNSHAVGPVDLDGQVGNAGSGLPMLDEAARNAYRRRLAEIDDDIDTAALMNDPARRQRAEQEREFLLAELTASVGLGGRLRSVGSDAERARTAVTRSIRYALEQLARHQPAMSGHLEHAIRTGTYCRYVVDPVNPIDWAT